MDIKNTIVKYTSIVYELNQLYNKASSNIKYASTDGYVYSDTYRGWLGEYNKIVEKYNGLTGASLSMRSVQEYELSSTKKTVRFDVASTFVQSIKSLADKIDSEIRDLQNSEAPIPIHQMRMCFKTGAKGCPLNPPEKKNRVFVAMSFSDEYKDSYEYGIKLVLDKLGFEHYKADNEISNKDIMCKICRELQSCGKIIANISGWNPNVMLELWSCLWFGKRGYCYQG